MDESFGDGGKLVTDFGGNNETARAVSIQRNGKILAAGFGGDGDAINFVLACYRNNGSLDVTFGKGGKVSTDFFGGIDEALGIAVQRNGRIVAAGSVMQAGDGNDFGLVRYRRNGRVDSGFGDAGKVTTDFFGGSNDRAEDITLMKNGDILLVGSVVNGLNPLLEPTVFALARYRRDGTLDTKFGSGGKVTTDFGAQDQFAAAVVLQPDGKIVVVGSTGDGSPDFALARYLSE